MRLSPRSFFIKRWSFAGIDPAFVSRFADTNVSGAANTNKTFGTDREKILEDSAGDHFIVLKSRVAVLFSRLVCGSANISGRLRL